MGSRDDRATRARPGVPPAAAGAVAAASALAAAELLAGLLTAVASPIELIGDRVIDVAPPVVKDLAIAVFGTADKLALQVGTVIMAMAVGAGLGAVTRRWWALGAAGFALFGILGIAAALASPRASLLVVMAAVGGGVAVGLAVLHRLLEARPADGPGEADTSRRPVLLLGLAAAGAVAAGGVGRWLLSRGAVDTTAAALPAPTDPLPPRPEGLDVEGLSPLFTPNATFYRIDTALRVPRVDPEEWSLTITGLVERELTLAYAELQRRATVEADVTIACVSNEVGGDLVGTARWQGVRLADLLGETGVSSEARQVVGRAVDGFTAAFPVDAALDGREALVALGMNGQPLPLEHGFPARLVVPGLYGYVSATKWLDEIELVTDAFEGYWVPRGWAKRAPIKTQSRIDVPRPNAEVAAGTVPVAGVAWAPTRGIAAVEVRVDDGPWREARLGPAVEDDVWRQWMLAWDATPGSHRLQVRATDGDGNAQTDMVAPPRPDGATGHHTITVDVAA